MQNLFVIFVLILFILVLAGAGCDYRPNLPLSAFLPSQTAKSMLETKRITLRASDGVTIVGQYAKPAGAKQAVLLLHMMPATKESWRPLSELIQKKGLATLAIDLRGHGESTAGNGGQILNYKNFSDQEHQASRLDVAASLEFLKKEGFDLSQVAVVGASIGANLALQALAEQPEIKKAVALSPGLDYRGVTTAPAMKNLSNNQKVFLVAANDDADSADTVNSLAKITPAQTALKVYPQAGHGTDMWEAEPTLLIGIVEWLTN